MKPQKYFIKNSYSRLIMREKNKRIYSQLTSPLSNFLIENLLSPLHICGEGSYAVLIYQKA
jgi:hypothetical protein